MGVPIVATPGGVVSALDNGIQTGMALGDAIITNKRITPELATLLQQTYGAVNGSDQTQTPQDQSQDAPSAPSALQDTAQPSAQHQAAFNPQFMQHFMGRLQSGEDPAQLGKEARLALEGHLPNHPALGPTQGGGSANLGLGSLSANSQPLPSQGALSPPQLPMQVGSGVNFGNLINRDLPTARAMVGDLASYRARRASADVRARVGEDSIDQRRDAVNLNNQAKGSRQDKALGEKARESDNVEQRKRDEDETKDLLNRARAAHQQIISNKGAGPATEEGRQARASAAGLVNLWRQKEKEIADNHKDFSSITPEEHAQLNELQKMAIEATNALSNGGTKKPQNSSQNKLSNITKDITSKPQRIQVSNGKETLEIDAKDEAGAAVDGYKRVQ